MAIPYVPIQTAFTDANGMLTRAAIAFLQGVAAPTAVVARELILSVVGTLAIESNAAPPVTLFATATATQFIAVVKQAPTGAALVCNVNFDGTPVATITIAAGATAGTTPVPVSYAFAAGDGTGVNPGYITLDIIAVGTTIPGSDLSVLIGF